MEFPYGHTHTHHTSHHRLEEEEKQQQRPHPPPSNSYYPHNQPPPPPNSYYPHNQPPPPPHIGGPPPFATDYYPPPPPPHIGGPPPPFSTDYYPPPPPPQNFNYSDSFSHYPPPPQPQPTVQHVSHETHEQYDHHRPHMPSFVPHQTHHEKTEIPNNKPTVRVYSKAKTDFSLTIRNGKVILAKSDPADPFQHWIKDEKFSTRVKDEEGFPSFALVNKATGQAVKHSIGATYPVQLTEYNPNKLDESVLWTQSKDLGDGYRAVRMVNNIRLNVDAFNGDKNHGGVHDGTTIVLWEWKKGDNQRWTMIPYCKILNI